MDIALAIFVGEGEFSTESAIITGLNGVFVSEILAGLDLGVLRFWMGELFCIDEPRGTDGSSDSLEGLLPEDGF